MATFTLRNHPIGSLSTGKWPDRVRPMLCIERGTTAEVIAYFRDEDARRDFDQWLEYALRAAGATIVPVED